MSVGLGASHNYVHIADSAIVDMNQCESVTVYVYESAAEAVVSLKRRKDGGSPAAFDTVITEYFTSSGAGGVWSRQTQTADDEVTKTDAAAQSLCAIEVYAEMLKSDGGDYNELEVEVDGSAVVSLVLNGLKVQRAPQNLPAAVG